MGILKKAILKAEANIEESTLHFLKRTFEHLSVQESYQEVLVETERVENKNSFEERWG
jgi:hypothetical protein